MRETWYVLESGRPADPAECALDDDGVMRHKGGEAVAMRGDAYSSRGMDPAEIEALRADGDAAAEKAKAEAAAAQPAVAESKDLAADTPAEASPMKGRELKPEKPGKGYKTKDAKAES